MADILYIVVPCYNEEEVLPETSRRLRAKLEGLMAAGKISERSLPQPGAPECPAGGADDGEGAVRHGHLHGRRPPGRH